MPNLFGTGPNQAPTNGDLGTLAFQDANAVKITGGEVTAVQKTDTAISETNPSLNLDFANTKSLDPRITFTRNTTATFYDGKTVAKAEENLMIYSQEFDNAAWGKSNVTVATNSTVAPDGTTTAEKLLETATSAVHRIARGPGGLSTTLPYTFSCFVKAAERNYAFLQILNAAFDSVSVDLTTGTATSASGSPTNITSTNAGNGWWRISFTATPSASTDQFGIITSIDGVYANRVYTGDGTSGIFIWGAQLEQRSAVSSYTPTTSSPVTNYIPALQTCPVNSARFDHDPVTGESKGLLIEEQRTNLYLYSADLNQSGTSATRSTNYPTSTVAPDGSLTGNLLVEDTSASTTHYYYKSFSATSGTSYTISCYIKAKERSIGYIQFYTTSSVFAAGTAYFDLSNVTVVISGTITSSSITPVGNGWYRVSATQSAAATATGVYGIGLTNSTASTSYTGNGISGMYFWGAQLEAGAFPTSYIPTTDQQKTRSADAASITGTNFSSWYRQDEGTLYAESQRYASASTGFMFIASINDGTSNNAISTIWGNSGSFLYSEVSVANVAQAQIGYYNMSQTASYKTAGCYKVNDFAFTQNASTVQSDTSGVVPVVTKIDIGNRNSGAQLNGTIKKLTYFPKRLSNDELVEMTS